MQHRSILCSLVILCAAVVGACGTEPTHESCSVTLPNSSITAIAGVSTAIGAVAHCSETAVPVVRYASSAPDIVQVDSMSGLARAMKSQVEESDFDSAVNAALREWLEERGG